MMLIGYLYGITSNRKLCQEVHLNLAYRWFCGLGLEGKVSSHSTFSKISHSHNALMDNQCGVIVEAESSDPSLWQEALSCVEMTGRFKKRTGAEVDSVGGDSAYAKGEILGRMKRLDAKVYAPNSTNIPKPDDRHGPKP